MQCDYGAFKMQAVLNGEGTQFHAKGFMPGQIISCDWLSEEKLEALKEDRDPADAPSCPQYKPQPDKPGKLLWFSGK